MRRLWADYWVAFRDLNDWLAGVFLPWRWVVGFYWACRDVRTLDLWADEPGVF